MGVEDGLKVALFVMALVFVLLAVIYALIRLMSEAIRRYSRKAAGG